jgi:putative (di)nucleoside polyphosphate hydrolase
MAKKTKLSLRPNVCLLVYNPKGQLFLGERLGKRGHWQFPQGGVERGRSRKETVLRELREEIGIGKKSIGAITKLSATHEYLWKKVPDYAVGKWIGQSQTFWLVEFTGKDSEIDLATTDNPEFRSWRWCSVTAVRRMAAKERRYGYEAALLEFVAFRKAGKKK